MDYENNKIMVAYLTGLEVLAIITHFDEYRLLSAFMPIFSMAAAIIWMIKKIFGQKKERNNKMKHNKLFKVMLFALILIITSFTGGQSVMAEESEDGDTHYNIEIVVDASGSLQITDPENNRYTAIDIFLQTLRENGNNVGSVVFTTKIEEDTGLRKMNGKNSKEKLSNQIKSHVPGPGDTNIGLALQTAVDNLNASNDESEKIILLLSDGNTDMGSKEADEASLEIERKAIEQCITDGIKVYGICLNSNGAANLEEFKDMTSSTAGAFLEVKSSENLVAALKDFYGQIFKTKFISDQKTIKDGTASKSIEVPSYGVEELNITINNASQLSGVTITKPDGVDISANEFSGISSLIGDYYFIKITEPDEGLWDVTVKGKKGTEITFDFVFNTDNTAGLETVSEETSFSLNEDVELSAGFYSNGEKLIGEKYYEYYAGTVVVDSADSEDGKETQQYYPMEADGKNGFKASLSYDKEGTYEVYAVLTCGEFESLSEPITISIGNALPEFSSGDDAATVKITKLFNKKETIDIGQYFSDKEDKKLALSVIASSYEDGDLEGPDGNEIILKKLVDGKMTVQAEDKNGGTVKGVIQIEVRNLTWIPLLACGVLLLVAIGIIIFKIIDEKKRFFAGYLNVFSASQVDDSNSRPAANFTGKYLLSNFCLMNHQFDNGMYFKVLPDKSIPGYGSHKLRLVSSKTFYYLSPSGETAVKSLDMATGMTYDIRSASQEDSTGYNDTISISLEES